MVWTDIPVLMGGGFELLLDYNWIILFFLQNSFNCHFSGKCPLASAHYYQANLDVVSLSSQNIRCKLQAILISITHQAFRGQRLCIIQICFPIAYHIHMHM